MRPLSPFLKQRFPPALLHIENLPYRRFDDDDEDGDREQTPDGGPFVRIAGEELGEDRAHDGMIEREPPGAVKHRQKEADEKIGNIKIVNDMGYLKRPRLVPAIQRHVPGDMPVAGDGA